MNKDKSKQQKWQEKQKLLGKCVTCGKNKAINSNIYCDFHLIAHRTRNLNAFRITHPNSPKRKTNPT